MIRCLALFAAAFAVAHAETPVDLIMVLDVARGMEQSLGLLHPRALKPDDRAGVMAAHLESVLLQPLTNDRDLLAGGIRQAGTRFGAAVGKTQLDLTYRIDLTSGIELACEELEKNGTPEHRRAILVVFGTDDPQLKGQMGALKSLLKANKTRLYAAVIDRSTSQPVTPPGVITRPVAIYPVITAQLLEELAEASGGRVYRLGWDLKEVLKEIRKP